MDKKKLIETDINVQCCLAITARFQIKRQQRTTAKVA
jgi:hypothetical protein